MKREALKCIITTAILLVCSVTVAVAQNNSVVKIKSDVGQGYLVLHKSNHPDVDHWKLSIIKRIYTNDSTFTDQLIEETTLPSGKNYKKIPKEYRERTYNGLYHFVKIEGFTSENEKAVEEIQGITIGLGAGNGIGYGPVFEPICPGCTFFGAGCKWTCNGTTYAWDIQQYIKPTASGILVGPSKFVVESAYDHFDENQQIAIPYLPLHECEYL